MFSAKLDTLLISLRPTLDVRPVPSARARDHWNAVERRWAGEIKKRAERALEAKIPFLYYGDAVNFYKDGDATYREGRTVRRELLKALVLGYLVDEKENFDQIARIADLIWAIAEEANWASPAHLADGRFLSEPLIDEDAADTAGLLASCHYLLDGTVEDALAHVFEYAARKIRRHVLEPFIERDDWQFLTAPDFRTPRVLEGILTAALLDEEMGSRWLCVRKVVGSLDEWMWAMPNDGGFAENLEEHMRAVAALDSCLRLLSRATAGEVEYRGDAQYRNMVHLFCMLHIGEGWFANSGEGSIRPALPPEELFQMGHSAGDSALMGLAAYLNRRALVPFEHKTPPLLDQARCALLSREFCAAPAYAPSYPSVNLPDMQFFAKRVHGFYAALSGGSGWRTDTHASVGNVLLFFGTEPILIDVAGLSETEYHNLPTIDGMGQTEGERAGTDAMFRDEGAYTIMSMNIAGAYPVRADLMAWQRSVMFMPFEESVRLIDVYDFDRMEHYVNFHFLTPHKPEIREGCVRLGPVLMEWEGDLTAHATHVTLTRRSEIVLFATGVYQLTLKTGVPARSGNYTFIFRAI